MTDEEVLDFRWSKKVKTTLETKAFGKTFLSVFWNFLHFMHNESFLHFMHNESLPMNLVSVSRFTNAFIRSEKNSHSAVNEKRKTEKSSTLFYLTGYFKKPWKSQLIFFSSVGLFVHKIFFLKFVHSVIFVLWCQEIERNVKMGNWERQIARNSKLQYLFQKHFQCFSNEHNTIKFPLLTKVHIWHLIKVNDKKSLQ